MQWSLASALVVTTVFTFGCASHSRQVALEEPVGSSRLRGYPPDYEPNRTAPPPAAEDEDEDLPAMRAHERSEGIGLPGPLRGSNQGVQSAAAPMDPGMPPPQQMPQAPSEAPPSMPAPAAPPPTDE